MSWEEDNLRCLGIEPSERDWYNTIGLDSLLFVSTTAERLDKVAEALEGRLAVPKPARQLPNRGPLVYRLGGVSQATPGCKLELWASGAINHGAEDAEQDDAAAANGGAARSGGGASLVLGAGNHNFVTTVDVIERVFLHKECVLLKHHPIRPFLAAPLAHIFMPLVARGAFAHCLDSDVNGAHAALVSHPLVSHIHMTGSGATHDGIVSALEVAGRKEVQVTSELGCVTPWIVCPGVANNGVWRKSAIEHHAAMLASAVKIYSSMNCLSPKVVVLPTEKVWPQRARFLEALRRRLAAMPQPPPYYPGAHKRFAVFEREYPDAERIAAPPTQSEGRTMGKPCYSGQDLSPLPNLLVDVGTLGSDSCRTYALQNEAFAPVLAIATVESDSARDFALAAARAVNQHVFGTLSCMLIYPDARDRLFDAVVQELNYGCVAVNMWSAWGYWNPLGVWGGAPGSYSRSKPQSGRALIGNVSGVPNVLKGVHISPFVNKLVALSRPFPRVVLDSLVMLISKRKTAVPHVFGMLLGRAFGALPPKMPAPKPTEDSEWPGAHAADVECSRGTCLA